MSPDAPVRGSVAKLRASPDEQGTLRYRLPLGEAEVELNSLLGRTVHLTWQGSIHCEHCGRQTKKSFNQGYCYPCFTRLASCDLCIMSPERCHFHLGTCREPEWAEQFCMTEHIVYLANSSAPKVGITRRSQIPTRWIDQGATQALPLFRVQTRQQSGLVETLFKAHIADKTSWQAMLKGEPAAVNLSELAEHLCERTAEPLAGLHNQFGLQAIQRIAGAEETRIRYPVLEYPSKVKAHNLDKTPSISGTLLGIKGQYLLLDTGVLNVRKYTAYTLELHSA